MTYVCFLWSFFACFHKGNADDLSPFPPFSKHFCLLFVAHCRFFFKWFLTVFAHFLSLGLIWYGWQKVRWFERGFSFVTYCIQAIGIEMDACNERVHVWSNCLHIYELFSVWTTNNQQATTASCNRPLIALEIHSTMALKNAHMRIPKGGIWSHQMQPFFLCSMPTLFVDCVWYCPRIDRITMPVTQC